MNDISHYQISKAILKMYSVLTDKSFGNLRLFEQRSILTGVTLYINHTDYSNCKVVLTFGERANLQEATKAAYDCLVYQLQDKIDSINSALKFAEGRLKESDMHKV